VGYPSDFTVDARDAFGNLLQTGGNHFFNVIGRGPSKAAVVIGSVAEDCGNGTYIVSLLVWWG